MTRVTDETTPPVRDRSRRRRTRRIIGWTFAALGAVALVLVVAAVLVGMDALKAQASLQSASDKVGALRQQVISGDEAAVAQTLPSLQADTAAAYADTHGWHWWVMARTPFVGPTVDAVQTSAEVIDSVAVDALPALTAATDVLDPAVLVPQGGRIDLNPFIDVAPLVVTADDAVQAARGKMDAIEVDRVNALVAGPVTDLQGMVDELAMTTATASRAAQLLPSMLGAYGQRTYILLAQNNAEPRATGGIPGAWIAVTANNGEITIGDRNGAPATAEPVLPITEEEDLLFTDRLATYGQNVNLTPDFPRSAELARAIWAVTRNGQQVDGVVSVDPVMIQGLLGVIGPVTMASGQELNGENASRVLLNEIYIELENTEDQDAYFADAASSVFDALLAGGHDVSRTIDALAESANQGRLMVWSADPREEQLLGGTVLSGEMRGDLAGAPLIGVYLNDASATKIGYYLDYSVSVERTQCLAGGRRLLTVSLDITSTAPPEVVTYPWYISGGGWLPPGTSLTNVMVYGPTGGRIESVRQGGAAFENVGFYANEGLDVAVLPVTLAPGESQSFEFDVETGQDQDAAALLRVTPGARNAELLVNDSPC